MPKIDTPEEFAQQFDPCARGEFIGVSESVKLITARDAAIRAESDELLRVCGEALDSVDSWWRLPNRERTVENIEPAIRKTVEALAALKDAGCVNKTLKNEQEKNDA